MLLSYRTGDPLNELDALLEIEDIDSLSWAEETDEHSTSLEFSAINATFNLLNEEKLL
jgi:hypothetical protein